jgi:hypothetical protein
MSGKSNLKILIPKVEITCILCGEPMSTSYDFRCFSCYLKEGGKTKANSQDKLFGSGSFVKKDKPPNENA